jgi:hypothetical protein
LSAKLGGLGRTAELVEEAGVFLEAIRHVRVLGAEGLLADGDGALMSGSASG